MSENDQHRPVQSVETVIHYEEPATKPPPLLAVGPLAWIRDNLFSSLTDIALTIIGTLIVVTTLLSLLDWAIRYANWFAITFNMHLFLVGRLEAVFDTRMTLALLFIAAMVGVVLAAYVRRISYGLIALLVVVVALVFIIPLLTNALIPLPDAYFAAGEQAVVSGSAEEMPRPEVAFIAREGEELTFSFAEVSDSDESLSQLNGFADVSSNTLRNAALNRLTSIDRKAELERLLAEDAAAIEGGQELGVLTRNQRAAYQVELEELEIRGPIVEEYNLNQAVTQITILDGETLEPLGEPLTLEPGGDPVTFTIPETGWYVFQKSVPGDETSVSLLAVKGIYPIFSTAGVFRRMSDDLVVEGPVPELEGDGVLYNIITTNQYRGSRPFETYMRIYLGPFLDEVNEGVLLVAVAMVLAYIVLRAVDSNFSPAENPRLLSRRIANWMLIASPIMLFLLINGIGTEGFFRSTNPDRWGGLLLAVVITVFGIIAAFPLGVALALGRRSSLPAVKYLCTLFIELIRGTPFIVVLFMMQLLIPLVNAGFADIPNVYRALLATIFFSAAYMAENVRGGLQSIPPGQEEAAKAVGLSGFQTIVFITLPQALRAVIPALVGQFISLFKDTSLLVIVGLIDLVGVVNTMVVQAEFLGTRREGLLFISIIYFVFSYIMSYASRRIEASGSGAARRI